MKQNFSTEWKASKQPRKQRKYRARAPLHIKHMFVSANLSKEFRKKYHRKSFPLRKGDTVKIMRGSFKGKTGKVENVDVQRARASVEKIQNTKKDGTKVEVFFHASNLQIKELQLEDKERIKALERNIKKEDKKKKESKVKEEKKETKEKK